MSDAGAPKRIKLDDLPEGPIRDIATFLEWGRQRGVEVGPVVQYNGLRIQVRDLRQARIEGFAGGAREVLSEDFAKLEEGGGEP